MQKYEDNYDSVQDPLFFWLFATSNALYLINGGTEKIPRIQYVLNGYRECLNKHTNYPSLYKAFIDIAFRHMEVFADQEVKKWIVDNKNTFTPVG